MYNTYNAQDQPNKVPDTEPQDWFLNQKLARFKYLLYISTDDKSIFNMATIVLDVQDESLLTQIKKACQLLKGVASVKVVSKREKSQACLNSSEREQAQAEL